ncbi:MAG: biotin carboxylase, partial [Leptospiraceae bacterium]|nr:biotin carboxylase [Leptospiraceae bacterium]
MQKRYINQTSTFVRSFRCDHLNILIVCRGPIRMEAMEVFEELGAGYGILLSEKDSVTYPHTLAPELRQLTDPDRVHRIPDYTGANREERQERIQQIIEICNTYGYTHIFAGYGFMAEDADFVESIEGAGIGFIGPRGNVHRLAGAKDQAKKLSRKIGVTVTPGLDNITSVTLIAKAGGRKGLESLAKEHGFKVDGSLDDEDFAEEILNQSYKQGVSLISVEDLQNKAKEQVAAILKENPGKRIRLKYIGGGGGKGQRIVTRDEEVPNAVMEVLSESKALGPLDNKNFLIEMNIESTRHNEIQLIGNGKWAVALGGRDCSLQMHEQKLVEISITDELFVQEIDRAKKDGDSAIASRLEKDRATLKEMEDQAERFAEAVGLNSASTFECIVSDESHYFMEMNTRIQVEHRVTEMAYSLRFRNPDNKEDFFDVESLVECMVLCSAHADHLPRPERMLRHGAGGEIRLNAMNDALAPHAGSLIESWTSPVEHEIRDDQGIGIRNPDTRSFIHYHLAGAYDSNIALIVTYGDSRKDMLERLADILRQMEIRGNELSTNKEFHYGILNFLIGMHPMLKPDTRFTVPYLSLVGTLAGEMEGVDL